LIFYYGLKSIYRGKNKHTFQGDKHSKVGIGTEKWANWGPSKRGENVWKVKPLPCSAPEHSG